MNQQEFQNKQLRMMQIQTAILAAILILLLAAGIFLAVQLADLGHLMDLMEQQLLALDLEQINQAVASLTDTVDAMDMKALNGAVASLKGAAGNLSAVDMQALNAAIDSLSGAAEGLQEMDFAALNDLVETLGAVAARLERVTEVFGYGSKNARTCVLAFFISRRYRA